MSLATLIALGIGFSLTAYAVLAGADFGAGILDLTVGAKPQHRVALARTIGPLWEANHVWLIFTITSLFSAFPTAFAALGTALLAPFTLALIAIVVRGVAFSLRTSTEPPERIGTLLGRAFGAASVAAPLNCGQASRWVHAVAATAALEGSEVPVDELAAGGFELQPQGGAGLLAVRVDHPRRVGPIAEDDRVRRAGARVPEQRRPRAKGERDFGEAHLDVPFYHDRVVRLIDRPYNDARDITAESFHEQLWSAGFDTERDTL